MGLCSLHSNGNEGRVHEQVKARCDRSHLAPQKPGYSYPHDINIKKKPHNHAFKSSASHISSCKQISLINLRLWLFSVPA